MAEVGLVGMAYELLRDLGWARGEGAGHCRHKIDGCCLILRAWHKPCWLPRPSGGLKDRVEKDIEWVDFLKDWILFQCQFCSRTNHCFDRELMKDCCVRCEIQIVFFFNFLIFFCLILFIVVFLIYIFFPFCFGIWDSIKNSNTFFCLFSSLDFTVPVSHNLDDVQFCCGLAFFLSRGVHFLVVVVVFFSIANYYSWVLKDWDFFDKKDINGKERLGFFFQKKYWWKTFFKERLAS